MEVLRLHIIVPKIEIKLRWQLLDREHGERVLNWIEVVILGFDQVVFAPLREPFPLLIFNNHPQLLILQIISLLMQLDADKSLSQKVFTKGLISSNLKFVEISSLVSISNVKDFLLENIF